MQIDHDTLRDSMTAISLISSLFLLFIHIKNRKTQHRTYLMARDAYHSSGIDVGFVRAEQLGQRVLLRFVVFNPASGATIIKSARLHRLEQHRNWLLGRLGVQKWYPVDGSRWWPSEDPSDNVPKNFADGYRHLLVKEHRDIMVTYSGYLDRALYALDVKTSRGGVRTKRPSMASRSASPTTSARTSTTDVVTGPASSAARSSHPAAPAASTVVGSPAAAPPQWPAPARGPTAPAA